MATKAKFNGIYTVTVTPFGKDGAIDFKTYGKVIDFVLANGVHSIVPCGTTGEYFNLTTDERKAIFRFVADHTKGKVELWAGANSSRPAEIIELGRYAKGLGYKGLLLAAPFYSLPTTSELVEHYKHIDREVGLPIMLYNFPARTGVDMNLEFLRGLKGVRNIVGIKESSGSMARMHELLVDFSKRYEIVCGADDQALEYFLWGIRSWVAGASNFLPAAHVALYEACVVKRDFVRGREIMDALLPLFMLMEQGGKYLQLCKYGCALAGIPVGEARRPLLPLTSAEKAAFRKLYAKAAKVTRAK